MKMKLSVLIIVGMMIASATMVLIPKSSAQISWGRIGLSAKPGIYYIDRYGTGTIKLTAEYIPLITEGVLYASVTLEVISPDWLKVSLSKRDFEIKTKAGMKEEAILTLHIARPTVEAGTQATVSVTARGELMVKAGRTLKPTTIDIPVIYNPFTEIEISAKPSIEEAAPDTKIEFPVIIRNVGNAASTVTFALGGTAEDAGWRLSMSPPSVKVWPATIEGESPPPETAILTLYSPHGTAISYHNKMEDVTITATARCDAPYYEYVGGEWVKVTEPMEYYTSFSIQQKVLSKNEGFYVPGFEVLPLIAALGIAIILIRKRK